MAGQRGVEVTKSMFNEPMMQMCGLVVVLVGSLMPILMWAVDFGDEIDGCLVLRCAGWRSDLAVVERCEQGRRLML